MSRWKIAYVVAVLLCVSAGRTSAYVLQFQGYAGSRHLWGEHRYRDWTTGEEVTERWDGTEECNTTNLASGGGRGPGAFLVGETVCNLTAYSGEYTIYRTTRCEGLDTFSWSLASEYGREGMVELGLDGFGRSSLWESENSGWMSVSVTAGGVTWHSPGDFYWSVHSTIAVPIGGTIVVSMRHQAGTYASGYDVMNDVYVWESVSLILPEESVPEPATLLLMMFGGTVVVRGRAIVRDEMPTASPLKTGGSEWTRWRRRLFRRSGCPSV